MTTIDHLNLTLLHAAAEQALHPIPPPDVTELCRDLHDHDEARPDDHPQASPQLVEP